MELIAQTGHEQKIFVGLDVHKKTYSVTVLEIGKKEKAWTMPASPTGLVEKLKKDYPDQKILSVYEAGFSGFVLHRRLVENGIENIVVNPSSVAVSIGDRVKTDKRDSSKLAKHLAAGLLTSIRIPTVEEEMQRLITRTREQLVRSRVRAMIQIRSRLVYFGYFTEYVGVLRRGDVESFLLQAPEGELRSCVTIQLHLWEALDKEIKELNRLMYQQGRKCPLEDIYRSVPGIGKVAARVLANELGDMSQFKNEKALFRFVGLTPSEHSSGESIKRGSISRQGNSLLRKVLVECAWVAIRRDQSLRAFYSRLSATRGSKKAIVATARKLVGKIRAAHRKNEVYQHEIVSVQAAA